MLQQTMGTRFGGWGCFFGYWNTNGGEIMSAFQDVATGAAAAKLNGTPRNTRC